MYAHSTASSSAHRVFVAIAWLISSWHLCVLASGAGGAGAPPRALTPAAWGAAGVPAPAPAYSRPSRRMLDLAAPSLGTALEGGEMLLGGGGGGGGPPPPPPPRAAPVEAAAGVATPMPVNTSTTASTTTAGGAPPVAITILANATAVKDLVATGQLVPVDGQGAHVAAGAVSPHPPWRRAVRGAPPVGADGAPSLGDAPPAPPAPESSRRRRLFDLVQHGLGSGLGGGDMLLHPAPAPPPAPAAAAAAAGAGGAAGTAGNATPGGDGGGAPADADQATVAAASAAAPPPPPPPPPLIQVSAGGDAGGGRGEDAASGQDTGPPPPPGPDPASGVLPLPSDPPPAEAATPDHSVTVTMVASPSVTLAPADGPPPTVMFVGAGQEMPAPQAAEVVGEAGTEAGVAPAAAALTRVDDLPPPKISPAAGWGMVLGATAFVFVVITLCTSIARLKAALARLAADLAGAVHEPHGVPR